MNKISCAHGHLARSCEICELIAERDALKGRMEGLEVRLSAHDDYILEIERDRDALLKRAEELSGAIKRIYTTQMYEDRKKESGVSVEMVSAILDAATLAGCREEI